VGQVSEPLSSRAGVHLLMVCAREDGGVAAAAPEVDRQEVAERLREEQMQRLARRYLRDLRANAFVDLRLDDLGAGVVAGG
jgi:peptidyl-prolyl cis-trans isomerase SurA